ncbi:MAG: ABC transporter permease, partial [bacterium]|nr:ABC transporter permease [bacterium]
MFKNYFLSALRNLKKAKLFSVINVLGLSIGMASCLLILHYVDFERSYDKFHKDGERIFRLCLNRIGSDGTGTKYATSPPPAGARIRGRYLEVETVACIHPYSADVSFGAGKFYEKRMYFAEPEFLDILKFKFIEGDRQNGLTEINKTFISQSTAKKYFGTQNP